MRTDLQKPPRGSHAKVKARNKRVEAKLIRQVRAACVARDGHCRYAKDVSTHERGVVYCSWDSEWTHLEDKRRFKTRNQPPEHRHTTRDSAMLCGTHHDLYDERFIKLTFLSELGADGPIAWERR